MTAKQRAKKLMIEFSFLQYDQSTGMKYEGLHEALHLLQETKQCAIIAVNEIIRTLNEDIRDLDVRGSILLRLIDYWKRVKKEIEKL